MEIQPRDVLQQVFGFEEFRGMQGEIAAHVASGGDAFVVAPTGSGKSICYQVPALCREGVGVVISPLLALMRDQIEFLEFHGVEAASLDSTLTKAEAADVMERVKSGEIELLYVTPERMANPRFVEFLKDVEIALFAIDECHCVSQWGHDFRPDYRTLTLLSQRFPGVPRIAVTATADPETQADVIRLLDMEDARRFSSGFDRPNIRYSMEPKSKKAAAQLDGYVSARAGSSGIVYCLGRATVDKTAARLAASGISALPYHAGMSASERADNQDAFIRGKVDVLVATVAFGMGIDKPDIRYVVHADMPSSLEAWCQESGRAGRDGEPAEAMVFFNSGDVTRRRRMLRKGAGNAASKRSGLSRLDAMIGVCETVECRRRAVLGHFGEAAAKDCGNCDRCQSPPATRDASGEARAVIALIDATPGRLDSYDVVTQARSKAADGDFGRFRHGEETWSSTVRQMVSSGLLRVSFENGGGLEVTQRGRSVAEGGEEFRMPKEKTVFKVKAQRTATRKTAPSPSTPPASKGTSSPRRRSAPKEGGLLRALRLERDRIARGLGVKRYFVIHDEALRQMADTMPRSGRELAMIRGVGPAKLDRFGADFLGVIERHA